MSALDRSVWAAHLAIAVGAYHVGVRVGSAEIEAALRSAFGPLVVADPRVPANYSILSEQPSRYRVYRGCDLVFTALSVERAVVVLLGHLQEYLPDPQLADRHLKLQALALVHAQEAVLIPHRMLYTSPTLESRLVPDAVMVLERTSVIIDPSTGDLVVPPLSFGSSVPRGSRAPRAALPAQTVPGRYALKGWLVLLDSDHSHVSPAMAVAAGMVMARHGGEPTRTMHALVRLVDSLAVFGVANSRAVIECVRRIWP